MIGKLARLPGDTREGLKLVCLEASQGSPP
jgi:hypothetical protein